MTPSGNDRRADALRLYADNPLDDGDGVLLIDDDLCLEIEGLARNWDAVLRRNMAGVVRTNATRVVVAIARPQGLLLDSDYQLWRDLHADLRDSEVDLLPVRALPAA